MSEAVVSNKNDEEIVIFIRKKGKKVGIHFFSVDHNMGNDGDLDKEYETRGLRYIGPRTLIRAGKVQIKVGKAKQSFAENHTICTFGVDEKGIRYWFAQTMIPKETPVRKLPKNGDDRHLRRGCLYGGVPVDSPEEFR